jgi:hypothetical protein
MLCRGRSVIAGASLLAVLTFMGIGRAQAQEQPPDLQMLLNLDLFSSSGGENSQAPAPGGSMLDQIQALRQMGYLQGNAENAPPPPGYGAQGGPYPPNDEPGGDTLVPWLYDFLEGNR